MRATEFNDLSRAMLALAEEAPDRTTLAQMTFFIFAGKADLAGKPATFTEIRDKLGPAVSRSLHTTSKLFLDRPINRSDYKAKRPGLGWLTREMDPADNRRNFLRLTTRGHQVLEKVLSV